jgi:tRNA (guanine6-N2)-methyltransferase
VRAGQQSVTRERHATVNRSVAGVERQEHTTQLYRRSGLGPVPWTGVACSVNRGGNGTEVGTEYVADVVEGLEEVARVELATIGARAVQAAEGGLRFSFRGNATRLSDLTTVQAVSSALRFDVPRPKALLGDAHFRRLLAGVRAVARTGHFDGFRFAAAGAGSSVFQRLAVALADATGLPYRPEDGELLLRIRPDRERDGWEVLVRLTPRPSSTRAWRVCNRPGGLNASVAAAMNDLVGAGDTDRYLNLMCGGGTLLAERALAGGAARIVGVDNDREAIACARANLRAAGVLDRVELAVADVTRMALPGDETFAAGSFDVLVADAPWGDAVGHHRENATLYPALLEAAARLAAPGARFALLSHEVRLSRRLLAASGSWRVERSFQVGHGGHHPLLSVLTRVGDGPDT